MRKKLIEQVKLFARLEANSFAGRDADLGSSARIASDTGLAGTHVEYAEAAEFNAFTAGERLLHTIEDGVYGSLRFCPWQSRTFHYALDKVLLNQKAPSLRRSCFERTNHR